MLACHSSAAAILAAALALPNAPARPEPEFPSRAGTRSVNLQRVRALLIGDARAVWVGDSWCEFGRTDRLPFGSLAVWPGVQVTAVGTGFVGGGGLCQREIYTSGDGSLTTVDGDTSWEVESNDGEIAHFGLPISFLTRLRGEAGLMVPQSGPNAHNLCLLRINETKWALTDAGHFADADDLVRARAWYYAPESPADMVGSIVLRDAFSNPLLTFSPATEARARWSLGGDPDTGAPTAALGSQMNAAYRDVLLPATPARGPQLVVGEDAAWPIPGSGAWWFFGGATYYKTNADGTRLPGLYHSGLSGSSWSFAGLGDDIPSNGGKNFSDEQLRNWLDVTTLDRGQTPVVILHVATELWTYDEWLPLIQHILDRFRDAFRDIGTAPPRFLLVGSYMHRIGASSLPESRAAIEALDAVYGDLAEAEPDCAFFSLYDVTDGTFLTDDVLGGDGANQNARDWLDAHGWSTITFGGKTYNLSSAENGGLDGVLVADGLHLASLPAAAFYAKLLGDAIAASDCPADFDSNGIVNTQDVTAFLNAWIAHDPRADRNGDGFVDTRDALVFLNEWAAGC
ncbi:MAG: hypothetical protein IPJ41_16475 [Phycisphaerales bacterium]|nr:hypothetical protein [Phycisphaerales bacterium]